MEAELVIAAVLLVLMLFLATVDAAFSYISDVGLRRISSDEDSDENRSSIEFLREILDNRQRFRFALSTTIQALLVTFIVLITVVISGWGGGDTRRTLLAVAAGIVLTVLFRQVVPRLIVRNDTERKLLFLLPAIRPIYRLASVFVEPFADRTRTKLQQRLESTITPDDDADRDEDSADDLQALMEVGEAEGIIEESEREMIETMVEFAETRVAEIMTPRTEIVAITLDATVREARDLIIEEKFSRLPVYSDSIDNIEGLIYVRDLMQAWAEGREDDPVSSMIRDAFFVPETKTADELLKDMQANHVQIAVVIDEYGGVAGIVTVEDIIEELVGEIEDEDTENEEVIEIREGRDGYWDVLGSTDIDKIERIFELELEDDDYTTIAGLVVTEAGHVPKVGEQLDVKGLSVEVLQADEKRITLLRLRKADDEAVGDAE